jgi:hypothetical protein
MPAGLGSQLYRIARGTFTPQHERTDMSTELSTLLLDFAEVVCFVGDGRTVW